MATRTILTHGNQRTSLHMQRVSGMRLSWIGSSYKVLIFLINEVVATGLQRGAANFVPKRRNVELPPTLI